MGQRTLSDGSSGGRIAEIPHFRPVRADVFAQRADRLQRLAGAGAWQPYLRFAAALSTAQQTALCASPSLPQPGEEMLARCFEHDMPPLSPEGHMRNPLWRDTLRSVLGALDQAALPPAAIASVDALLHAEGAELEAAADVLLGGAFTETDPAQAPLIAAALQVYWVKLALQLGEPAGLPAATRLCPLCGSHPLASVVRVDGAAYGLRYLVCSLCATEWHLVRVKCSACGSTKGISYFGIDGGGDAVKAECCDQCRTYLKIFYLEKDTSAVPAADDLATLALDVLVDQEGYKRVGPNLLFVPGAV
jgi:FdhE protein